MGESTGSGGLVDYVPQYLDFITIDVTIGAVGHEQQGYRRALVVSKNTFNQVTGLAVVCPITHTEPRNKLQLEIPNGLAVTGTLLVDQVRSIDYFGRRVGFMCKCPDSLFLEVLRCLDVIIFPKKMR